MTYSKKPKSRKTTLWSLLSSLPVYTSVKTNILFTEKLSPIILRQLVFSPNTNAEAKGNLNTKNSSLIESISLDAKSNKTTLNINCKNSAVVTQLRHSQESLLDNINQAINADAQLSTLLNTACVNSASANTVEALHFKVSAHSAPPIDPGATTTYGGASYNKGNADTHFDTNRKVRQSNDSRKSAEIIDKFSEQISDPDLSESLKRLANTLKETSPKSSLD